ncbi:MAG: hypothetical protein E7242_01345 [Lachnospiraceae bacterium]|nr:hypothetical protein [Lachnospiraceae bacterium]
MRKFGKITLKLSFLFIIFFTLFTEPLFAEDEYGNNIMYLGDLVNTGKDNGFSGTDEIDEDDIHYGWTLGEFFVTGWTSSQKSDNSYVFLKNVGDKVTLWFQLEQDINCLNGDEDLKISNDANGYDKYFGTEKTEMGKGALIIKHMDYQNKDKAPVIYTNYLEANAKQGSAIEVELFEEGDYEVALDYEIADTKIGLFGKELIHSYKNYRIFFKFSVRNGNCMAFPMEIGTNRELMNEESTDYGFFIDFAKSRYLDINIKRETITENESGSIRDVRFNRPAKDGEQYTDQGIYTISVKNRYTGENTSKTIYVLTSASEIINQSIPVVDNAQTDGYDGSESVDIVIDNDKSNNNSNFIMYIILAAAAAVIIILVIVIIKIKGNRKPSKQSIEDKEVFVTSEVVESENGYIEERENEIKCDTDKDNNSGEGDEQ